MSQLILSDEKEDRLDLKLLQKFMGLTEEEATNLVSILTSKTPKEPDEYGVWVENRPIRGGGNADYVPGFRFIQRLNQAFGFLWSFEVPEVKEKGDDIISKGRISVRVPGRTIERQYPDGTKEILRIDSFEIVKEQFGSAKVKRWTKDIPVKDKKQNQVTNSKGEYLYTARAGDIIDLGNDYKSASTDALKKCGTGFGLFMDVYGPKESEELKGPSDTKLRAFFLRAEACGMNEEQAKAWAKEQENKEFDKLTEQEVMGLTADLIQKAKENK